MTVRRSKHATTILFSVITMLMFFAIFVIVYNRVRSTQGGAHSTYIIDKSNVCEWENDVVVNSSDNVGSILETVRIVKSEEANFIEESSSSKHCVAKLGSSAGSYSVKLNKLYESQKGNQQDANQE